MKKQKQTISTILALLREGIAKGTAITTATEALAAHRTKVGKALVRAGIKKIATSDYPDRMKWRNENIGEGLTQAENQELLAVARSKQVLNQPFWAFKKRTAKKTTKKGKKGAKKSSVVKSKTVHNAKEAKKVILALALAFGIKLADVLS